MNNFHKLSVIFFFKQNIQTTNYVSGGFISGGSQPTPQQAPAQVPQPVVKPLQQQLPLKQEPPSMEAQPANGNGAPVAMEGDENVKIVKFQARGKSKLLKKRKNERVSIGLHC